MDAPALRALCLGFPGAVEERPFGPNTSAFKVGGKIFALSALDDAPLKVSLKCEPELAEQLRLTYPAVVPGYHLNKRHWNTITIDGSLDDQVVHDLVEDSYDLVRSPSPRRPRPRRAR
jgi:predicted DNA-binding protein (MmcQ/YjbR family)